MDTDLFLQTQVEKPQMVEEPTKLRMYYVWVEDWNDSHKRNYHGKAWATSLREAVQKLMNRDSSLQSNPEYVDGIARGGWGPGFIEPHRVDLDKLTYYDLKIHSGREYTFQPAGLFDHEYAR